MMLCNIRSCLAFLDISAHFLSSWRGEEVHAAVTTNVMETSLIFTTVPYTMHSSQPIVGTSITLPNSHEFQWIRLVLGSDHFSFCAGRYFLRCTGPHVHSLCASNGTCFSASTALDLFPASSDLHAQRVEKVLKSSFLVLTTVYLFIILRDDRHLWSPTPAVGRSICSMHSELSGTRARLIPHTVKQDPPTHPQCWQHQSFHLSLVTKNTILFFIADPLRHLQVTFFGVCCVKCQGSGRPWTCVQRSRLAETRALDRYCLSCEWITSMMERPFVSQRLHIHKSVDST